MVNIKEVKLLTVRKRERPEHRKEQYQLGRREYSFRLDRSLRLTSTAGLLPWEGECCIFPRDTKCNWDCFNVNTLLMVSALPFVWKEEGSFAQFPQVFSGFCSHCPTLSCDSTDHYTSCDLQPHSDEWPYSACSTHPRAQSKLDQRLWLEPFSQSHFTGTHTGSNQACLHTYLIANNPTLAQEL